MGVHEGGGKMDKGGQWEGVKKCQKSFMGGLKVKDFKQLLKMMQSSIENIYVAAVTNLSP